MYNQLPRMGQNEGWVQNIIWVGWVLFFLYRSLSLLRYCWDRKKVSQYLDYRNIQYKFLMLCLDIDLIS